MAAGGAPGVTVTDTMHAPSPAMCPAILPAGWEGPREVIIRLPNGEIVGGAVRYECPDQGLTVLLSLDVIRGRRWLHFSISHTFHYPTWDTLRSIKNWIVGREGVAYQALPKESEYVNAHPNCFHLWSPLDGDPFEG